MTPPLPSDPEHEAERDLGFQLPPPARLGPARAIALALVVVALLAAAFVVGFLPKRRAAAELESNRRAEAGPRKVEVVVPKVSSSDRALGLMGNVQPMQQTTIYARASGYVHDWKVDLGGEVAEGDTLVEIDTPDLDQEITQAEAQLQQAQATYTRAKAASDFSKMEVGRAEQLAANGLSSAQDLEKQRAQAAVDLADVGVASANIQAQRANVDRLTTLKGFARITAPFAGTVTSRSVEKGALVTAGNASPLFTLASTKAVRVLVQVPQDVAAGVRTGAKAQVSIRALPGRAFEGTVARTAGVLDPASRTMTVEVQVPNEGKELLPGMYAAVSLTLPMPHQILEIPSTSLFNDARGLRVAVVKDDLTVELLPVTIERDLGATIEISSGLPAGSKVVRLAAIDLVDGLPVTPVDPAPP
ncbi:MAG: efflux RND transporter periplasmic adaptor subunit [Polyangiaceae bacterium]